MTHATSSPAFAIEKRVFVTVPSSLSWLATYGSATRTPLSAYALCTAYDLVLPVPTASRMSSALSGRSLESTPTPRKFGSKPWFRAWLKVRVPHAGTSGWISLASGMSTPPGV